MILEMNFKTDNIVVRVLELHHRPTFYCIQNITKHWEMVAGDVLLNVGYRVMDILHF
jgi:hypothetical protein